MESVMTLGELTQVLERKLARGFDGKVKFDFVYFHPTKLASYRGDYAQLAFGYSAEGDGPTVKDVLKMLSEANGRDFTGYKGGDFSMSDRTTLWVANNGESGRTGICDVAEDQPDLILRTAHFDIF